MAVAVVGAAGKRLRERLRVPIDVGRVFNLFCKQRIEIVFQRVNHVLTHLAHTRSAQNVYRGAVDGYTITSTVCGSSVIASKIYSLRVTCADLPNYNSFAYVFISFIQMI